MIPPELLKWADLPIIGLIILASQVLRPVVARWLKDDLIILLPLVLGLAIGVLTELGTASFDLNMAVRRVLVDAFGAAGMFRVFKVGQQVVQNNTRA